MTDIKLHFKNESGKYECNYCRHVLAASTSTTRLRAHLIGALNSGTKICPNVPDDVRISLSYHPLQINKRKKTATGYILSSPSNLPPVETEGMTEATTTLVLPTNGSGTNNYFGNLGRLQFLPQQHTMPLQYVAHLPLGETSKGTIGLTEAVMSPNEISSNPHQIESGANNHYIPSFSPELNNDFGNQGGVLQYMMSTHPNESGSDDNLPLPNDMIGRKTQLQHQFTTEYLPPNESCSNLEPEAFPPTDLVTQDLRNCCLTVVADQHGVGDAEMVQQEVQMVEDNREGEGSAFRTKRLVGEAFVKNEGKIWSWLMDDQVLRVGIYGMGGVGKTTLMKHIQTRLKGQNSFKVYWVTVSQDFSIRKLQNLIAQKINLNFSDMEDEEERTEKLTQALQEKRKCVLILDDLWNYFDVEDLGIPVKPGGCKLVLTTRLLNVCQKMDCNEGNIIQVQALSRPEAWILFTKELGNYSTEVEQLAKFVAIECDGLPLGIRVMARAMKEIREVHSWKNALEELRESKLSEGHNVREEVFPVLKFSYLHLIDPALRKCLLYCALFPEDSKIDRGELIEYMILEGIIDARKSRQAEWDRGHTMLDTLVNACLLEGDTTNVWMHDLIRDMAIYELRERSNTLVEVGAQLKELPDVEKWTENLVRVSLISNDIEVIPSGHTPRCPNLSTLLLCRNRGLRVIADSFFEQFQRLKVLDLSWCNEIKELPRSISDLVNLTALLLHCCRSLIHVPSLAKLEKLKKLDLSECERLKQMPEGVRFLLNLKYLDLSGSGIEEIGSGIIPMLSRLQVLKLCDQYGISNFSIRGSEVGELRMLETLCCRFSNVRELGEYMKSRERSQQMRLGVLYKCSRLLRRMTDIKLHFKNESGKYECNYCRHDLVASTSTTRLRAHLIGAANAGTKICPNVPDDVRISLSYHPLQINKRQKTATGYILPSPSNLPPVETEGMTEATTTLVLPLNGSGANNYFGNQGRLRFLPQQHTMPLQYVAHLPLGETSEGTIGLTEAVMPPNETSCNPHQIESGANNHYIPSFSPELNNDFGNQGGVLQYMMSTHPNKSGSDDNLPLPNDMIGRTTKLQHQFTTEYLPPNESCSNLEPEAFPPTDLVTQDLRNCCLTVVADQHGVGDAEMVQQEVQMVEGNREGDGSAFRNKRLVGEAFVKNEGKIWSWLMDDQVLRVGIYGMGGVGKTTLMKHIQTRLKGQNSFKVYWVTVSQDFSIRKLQNLIAQKINLNFSDKEDEEERTEKLTQALQEKRKCVLILDDLWNYFDVEDAGIPVKPGGCKLVLTTRLLNVCQKMDCNEGNIIQVQALSRPEAWILFTKELGNYSTEVEQLAKFVAIECDGLPLGIRVMARAMKGIREVHSWRNALEELRESKLSVGHKMREEVFPVLKFSYLHLIDPALRKCLLYCALFPEDSKIDRGELIEYMILEGIIDARKSRQAEWDRGHTMLDTLVNACLLESDTTNVWMHDLIRDMAIYELRERSNTLVEAGAQLKELPDVEKWTENLVRVSLISNDIEVIPSDHTPRCPNLSTLLLCRNRGLRVIADSFFEQFQRLKVLDLSWCNEIKELPRSISDLVNLTALLLRCCRSLIHVPSLTKLEKLKKLDLSECERLKQMPEGVRFLLNLKYLDLSGSGIEEIGSGIIPMLSRLQVLKLCDQYGISNFSIRGSEVGELRMLETLCCRFSNVRELGEYMKSRERSQQSPSDYSIFIRCSIPTQLGSRKNVSVRGDNFIDPSALPTDIEALTIYNCDGTLYKRLFPPSLLASLLNLQEILVNNWGAIEEIFAMNEGENGEWRGFPFSNYSTRSLSNHSLLNLKLIDIWFCPKLKKIFPPSFLPNLHNLQKISVGCCYGMEEIFSTDQEEDGQELLFDQPNLTGLHLSRLTMLELWDLPELRSIYKGAIICHSLQEIQLLNCPKLKRITLPLPQPSLQRIQVYPKEWWESLQWGEANGKNHLESLCVFKECI